MKKLILLLAVVLAAGGLIFDLPGWAQDSLKIGDAPKLTDSQKPVDPDKIQLLPDLTIETVEFLPAKSKPGDQATFSFTVKNIGQGPAGPASIEVGTLPPPFTKWFKVQTQSLAPGASQKFSYNAVLDQNSVGNYGVWVDINMYRQVTETNYKNNVNHIYFTVGTAPPQLYDLYAGLYLEPNNSTHTFKYGGPATFLLRVFNNGPWDMPKPTFAVFQGNPAVLAAFGLSTNPLTIPILKKGEVHNVKFSVLQNKLLLPPGRYKIQANVNPNGVSFSEIGLENNDTTLGFTVVGDKENTPDLVLKGNIDPHPEVIRGMPAKILLEIRNKGKMASLGTKVVFEGDQVTAAAAAFGLSSPKPVPALAPGQVYNLTIPAANNKIDLPAGPHHIIARVNPEPADFEESDNQNNFVHIVFTVTELQKRKPDLTVKPDQLQKPGPAPTPVPPAPPAGIPPRAQPLPQRTPAVR